MRSRRGDARRRRRRRRPSASALVPLLPALLLLLSSGGGLSDFASPSPLSELGPPLPMGPPAGVGRRVVSGGGSGAPGTAAVAAVALSSSRTTTPSCRSGVSAAAASAAFVVGIAGGGTRSLPFYRRSGRRRHRGRCCAPPHLYRGSEAASMRFGRLGAMSDDRGAGVGCGDSNEDVIGVEAMRRLAVREDEKWYRDFEQDVLGGDESALLPLDVAADGAAEAKVKIAGALSVPPRRGGEEDSAARDEEEIRPVLDGCDFGDLLGAVDLMLDADADDLVEAAAAANEDADRVAEAALDWAEREGDDEAGWGEGAAPSPRRGHEDLAARDEEETRPVLDGCDFGDLLGAVDLVLDADADDLVEAAVANEDADKVAEAALDWAEREGDDEVGWGEGAAPSPRRGGEDAVAQDEEEVHTPVDGYDFGDLLGAVDLVLDADADDLVEAAAANDDADLVTEAVLDWAEREGDDEAGWGEGKPPLPSMRTSCGGVVEEDEDGGLLLDAAELLITNKM